MKTNTVYKCPLCAGELKTSLGNFINPGNPQFGLSLYCDNVLCTVEVYGHTTGNKRIEAYETIVDKYKITKF